jgi:FMN reductase
MKPMIVGFGGTTRHCSSSERIGRAVLTELERLGARTRFFAGADLQALSHFAPELPERTPEQRDFVEAIRACDGLVIGTPAYHGGISGMVKNAIDLLEDLRSDKRIYLTGRPVGLVVVSGGWLGCGTTLSAMRDVVHAMRGWPTPLGITVNSVTQKPFGENGEMIDEAIAAQVREQAAEIFSFACLASSQSFGAVRGKIMSVSSATSTALTQIS